MQVEAQRLQRFEVVAPLVPQSARGEEILDARLELLLKRGVAGFEQAHDRCAQEARLPSLRVFDLGQPLCERVELRRTGPLEAEQGGQQVKRGLRGMQATSELVTPSPGLQ